MSTLGEQEAVLRRALLAAAEQVNPAPDGFERIQRRLRRPRPLPVAWIEAWWADLFLNAPDFVQRLGWQVSRAFRTVVDRFGPVTGEHAHGPRWTGWLRPLAAMSVAVFVIAAGAYAALSIDSGASPASHSTSPTGTNPGSGKGGASAGTPATRSSSPAPSSGTSSSPSSGNNCKTSAPAFSPPPATSPPTSPSTTPSVTPSPSSPSPSPSDTTSSDGSDSSNPPTTAPGSGTTISGRTNILAAYVGTASDSPCPSTSTKKKKSDESANPDSASSARLANAQLAADESPARRSAAEAL